MRLGKTSRTRVFQSRIVALLAGLPVVGVPACGKVLPPPGELVVAVTTDLSIPKDIDTIRIQVVPPDGDTPYDYAFSVYPGEFSGQPTGVKIPATLGVLAGSGPVETVLVRVMAISTPKNETLILREASVQVPTNRTALLQLPLQWLSEGSAKDSTTSNPTLALPDSDKIVEARCKQGDTEIAGVCTSDFVDVDTLPDYEPGLVFGGGAADGGGTCFDTAACFANASPATLDRTACTVKVPAGADTSKINVALVPADGAGICASGSTTECFVPLDQNPIDQKPPDGWTLQGGRIQLPPGVCDAIQNGLAARVVVSTTCASKTPSNPTCGPWDADHNGEPGDSGSDARLGKEEGGSTDVVEDKGASGRDGGRDATLDAPTTDTTESGDAPVDCGARACTYTGAGSAAAVELGIAGVCSASGTGTGYQSTVGLGGFSFGITDGISVGGTGTCTTSPSTVCLDTTKLCASGTTGVYSASPFCWGAAFGFLVNQAMDSAGTFGTYLVPSSSTGIAYSLSSFPTTPGGGMRLVVTTGTAASTTANEYCSLIIAASGTVAWTSLAVNCWETPPGASLTGPPPDLQNVYFEVLDGTTRASFDICIDSITFSGGGAVAEGGTSRGVPIVANAVGYLSPAANASTGISGAWYAFGDTWGANGQPPGTCETAGKFPQSDCSVISSPAPSVDAGADAGMTGFPQTASNEFCLEGYAAKVLDYVSDAGIGLDYSDIYGIGLGANLNNPTGTIMPYNATMNGVVGFSFNITGTVAVGGVRFSVPMTTDTYEDEPYNLEITEDGPTTVLFSDLGVTAYQPPAGNLTFDATKIQNLEWQVISNATATNPPGALPDGGMGAKICISNLAAVLSPLK
jgi:hypothetical protein